MSRILTILCAAHCRSTHHYFALDALRHINTEQGGRLADLLLKHYDLYLQVAKDPDTKFRDFRNHVLHVGDGYWGGAPRACERWLKTAINHLNNQEWEDAAYDLGVLSHYFTDPLMPLHTGSSDGEGVVHRPMEWSVCKSYEAIYDRWARGAVRVKFGLPDGNNWISDALIAGAEVSHSHYERIIEIYDLERGVRRPPEGLNEESRQILAEMFGIAIVGWARILERVAEQSSAEIPSVSLSVATIVAAIDMPVAWITGEIGSLREQAAVKAIFKEFRDTGTVRENLPPEVRNVRTEMAMSVNRNHPPQAMTPPAPARQPIAEVSQPVRSTPDEPTAHEGNAAPAESTPQTSALPVPLATTPVESHDSVLSSYAPIPRTPEVSHASNLVDAPSIGPKTAKRFAKIGIHTIGEFVSASAPVMATKLDTRWIKSELVEDWQTQARLVCSVASLCGYKSQLLVAVECRTTEQLAQQSAGELSERITSYCETKAGERILRSSRVPDEVEVAEWIRDAATQLGRRAA